MTDPLQNLSAHYSKTWAQLAEDIKREKRKAEQQELFWGITLLMAAAILVWGIGLASLQVSAWLSKLCY